MRILLWVATNLAVMATVSIALFVLGKMGLLAGTEGLLPLAVMAGVVGFVGSFISLALSKWTAKRLAGVHTIMTPTNNAEAWLVAEVAKHAQAAGIGMPEVGIFNSAEANAFATGMTKNSSLVAVSTGLLNNMSQEEISAVLAHEVAHIANGDMVTLTLVQGVVNACVFFLARVAGGLIDRAIFKSESGRGGGYYLVVLVLELVLGFLASAIVAWYSRKREYQADYGGAVLTSKGSMQAALRRLASFHGGPLPAGLAAFGITGGDRIRQLFATHPPLKSRIAALDHYDLG